MHLFILDMKNNLYSFLYGSFVFQPISHKDIELLRNWRNKFENRTNFIFDEVISSEQQINWYLSYKVKNDDVVFMISEMSSGKLFATASLYNIDFKSSSAEFGRLMIGDEDFKGKSIGKVITSALISYAFNDLKLSKIYLEVFADNEIAIRTYERSGFVAFSQFYVNNRLVIKMHIENVDY